MKELASNKNFKKPSPVKDAAALSSLVGFLNATAGAVAPKENLPAPAAIRVAAPAATLEPTRTVSTQQTPATPQTAGAASVNLNRIFLTGRLKAGKDHIAEQAGYKTCALADPLYFLAEYFFGKQPKDAARAFLQTVGQWGRGIVSAEYPLTPERAMFVKAIRAEFSSGTFTHPPLFHVEWFAYGQKEDIWLNALISRIVAAPAEEKIAVSGVRFQNEYTRLQAEGFVPFHVMTSAQTWTARLKKVGLSPESAECKNSSEYLAASLDQSVTKTLSQQPQGNKLRCVWSDGEVLPPSRRLLTVREFCAILPKV